MSERKQVKLKKFKLDRELDTLPDWSAYGGVWRKFKPTNGVKQPDCTAEVPCLRQGGYTWSAATSESEYEYVTYSVSGNSRVVVQSIDNPFHARLIAASPEMLRFIKKIADGDALALSVVDDAKALIGKLREGVHVPGRHDYTQGPYDPDDYGSERDW